MTKTIKIAIVGRPNVGKSALFNCICKRRIAIVDEAEGITRDRLYSHTDFFGVPLEIIDTGGIHAKSGAIFQEEITRQSEIAIEEADAIILVVDAIVGLTQLDHAIAQLVLKTGKPACLAVNKVDNPAKDDLLHQFYPLGLKRMVPVSATHNRQIAELLESLLSDTQCERKELVQAPRIQVAIVGRPNVGKSSLVNYLLDEERCIVSPIPGTTRDSIDVSFSHDGVDYTLIDTAGIRRKQSEHEVVDKFAAMRTQRAIERADVCLLMLDAQGGMTTQEKKIANTIEEAGKGCILLFNKWDLVKGFRMEHCLKEVHDQVNFLRHCPTLFISALTGRNIDKIFGLVQQVYKDSKHEISTPQLNKFIARALQKIHPPMISGKRLRIYYMVQTGTQPPVFVLFVNTTKLMTDTYKKYLYNQFREEYRFSGVPIIMHLRGKKRRTEEPSRPRAHAEAEVEAEDDEHDEHDDFEEEDFPE